MSAVAVNKSYTASCLIDDDIRGGLLHRYIASTRIYTCCRYSSTWMFLTDKWTSNLMAKVCCLEDLIANGLVLFCIKLTCERATTTVKQLVVVPLCTFRDNKLKTLATL